MFQMIHENLQTMAIRNAIRILKQYCNNITINSPMIEMRKKPEFLRDKVLQLNYIIITVR